MKLRIDIADGKEFSVQDFTCGICNHYGPALSADNSDCEYGRVYICKGCIQQAFRSFRKLKKDSDEDGEE